LAKIIDVAREAGVSVATVSRVMNDHPNVNVELAERVRIAANKLGYRPNGAARSLRRQSSELIALIISDVGNPFFTAITRGVEDIAQQSGYSVLLCNADENSDKEATYLRVAEQEQVAGVILSPHVLGSDVTRLQKAGIPLVVIDRPLKEEVDSVMANSREGAESATNQLIDSGWSRPACITGPAEAVTAMERLDGYRDAIRGHGEFEEVFSHGPYRQHGGASAASSLLDSGNPPDAFLVANAQMALGVLDELKRRGLQIGRDVGIITFDDAPWAPFTDPPLSVVAQPAYDMGVQSAQLLLERIRGTGPRGSRHFRLSTTVIIRESSRRSVAE
jgi:LacI family transcriptional regulator